MDTLRFGWSTLYRLGLAPWDFFGVDPGLAGLVEDRRWVKPGRALDIGCGTGRNTIYLAQHGWDVTGVDLAGYAVEKARQAARKAGVAARLLQGDITRPDGLDLGDGYDLVVDFGCYHSLEDHQRAAYADTITKITAPAATLWMWALWASYNAAKKVAPAELRARFPQWELADVSPVDRNELHDMTARLPRVQRHLLRRAFAKGALVPPHRYRLTRTEAGPGISTR
ncbi:MAG TPA: class I SAM-dependent methyltransferase [Micromonosporaceae bacterium]|nr:class I SAM-dependent methyltransferase [Micromonosporaceae bacterium]